jgi:hypothetical protein
MKKRLQVATFVRGIRHVLLLQIFLLAGINSLPNVPDLLARKILEEKLTIQFNKVNLRIALLNIEKQTGAIFLYQSQLIPKEKITLHCKNKTLGQVLNKILVPRGILYEADGNYIILSQQEEKQASTTSFHDRHFNTIGQLRYPALFTGFPIR